MSKRASGFFGASILLLWLVTIIVLIPATFFAILAMLDGAVVFLAISFLLIVLSVWSILFFWNQAQSGIHTMLFFDLFLRFLLSAKEAGSAGEKAAN